MGLEPKGGNNLKRSTSLMLFSAKESRRRGRKKLFHEKTTVEIAPSKYMLPISITAVVCMSSHLLSRQGECCLASVDPSLSHSCFPEFLSDIYLLYGRRTFDLWSMRFWLEPVAEYEIATWSWSSWSWSVSSQDYLDQDQDQDQDQV